LKDDLTMCQCVNIKIVDVLYHAESGNNIVPYHKDCGENLSIEQKAQIDKSQREKWDKTGWIYNSHSINISISCKFFFLLSIAEVHLYSEFHLLISLCDQGKQSIQETVSFA